MGWQFDLKHANTVAYLTVPSQSRPPRLTGFQLQEFLGSIRGEYRERPPLLSSDSSWIERVVAISEEASEWVETQEVSSRSLLDPDITIRALSELRREFGRYELYGLVVGSWDDREPLQAFAEHAAYSSEHHGLFLIPDLQENSSTLEVFDPSPVTKKFTSSPDRWPGMLFWLQTGEAAFAAIRDAEQLLYELLNALRQQGPGGDNTARIIRDFNLVQNESKPKRILQLSDLHFGGNEALQNQAYLSAHLRQRLINLIEL